MEPNVAGPPNTDDACVPPPKMFDDGGFVVDAAPKAVFADAAPNMDGLFVDALENSELVLLLPKPDEPKILQELVGADASVPTVAPPKMLPVDGACG